MKKTNFFYLTLILIAVSFSNMRAQGFIKIDETQAGQQINIPADQVLEVQLPATPSTGYAWYLRNNNNEIIQEVNGVIEQVGSWEFISDNPSQPIGASGKQIIRFTGKAAGIANLNFAYMRPTTGETENQYSVVVKSDGLYTGSYKAPAEPEEVKADVSTVRSPSALPAAFSWLEQKMMTPCKNQASCGSCWAFAACGQFESCIKRFDGVTRDLSEQWLVNCDQNSQGCNGGWCPDNMFKTKGAVYEADLPYKGKDGTCGTYTYHEKILSYKEIATTPTVDQIKDAIYKYGPLWVAVCVGSNFNAYKSGVLTKTDAGQVNHAVVLCGWDDATQSWVMRNSWGTSWGENQGYMRIKYGTSQIGYKATYMIYKDATTGIDEDHAADVATVYPNPIVDGNKLTINLSNFASNEAINITICDVQGKVVYKQQEKQNAKVEVDAETFAKGLYFVNLRSESKSESYKIAKQ